MSFSYLYVSMMLSSIFISSWRTHFGIPFMVGLAVLNFLSYYLFGKLFISLSFLKYSFAGCNNHGWQFQFFFFFFPFRMLNVSSHSPGLEFLLGKATDSLMGRFLLCDKSFFFFCFKILFVFELWLVNCNVSLCSLFQVQPLWGLLNLMNVDAHFTPHLWEVFSHYCLNTHSGHFSFSFLDFQNVYVVSLMVFHSPVGFFHSFFFWSPD